MSDLHVFPYRDFDKAVDWAKQAGYKEFVTFSGMKIKEARRL